MPVLLAKPVSPEYAPVIVRLPWTEGVNVTLHAEEALSGSATRMHVEDESNIPAESAEKITVPFGGALVVVPPVPVPPPELVPFPIGVVPFGRGNCGPK